MAEKRIIRFEKWILKVVISYAVFIGIGWLLGRIPAEKIGLSEDMFFDLRMFFMLFGPIYLTLIVKIVLTILAVIKHKEKDTAEQNRGVLLAFTAILMLANLSNAQTMADLSSGLIESKGLKSLNRSKRYNLKGKRFLNVFLPIAFYILILEILTLLVCIVIFAPLSNAASNIFIFTIALTAMMLLVIPLILALISGFKGDKAEHEEKRKMEKLDAVSSGDLVLETDLIRRKQYLRLPKLLVLLVCPVVLLLSFFVLFLTKNYHDYFVILLLRQLFMALAGTAFLSVIPRELLRDIFGSACVSLGKPALLYRLQRQYGSAGGICLCPSPAGRVFFGKTLYPYPGNIYPEDKGCLRYASEKRLFQDALDSPYFSGEAGTE